MGYKIYFLLKDMKPVYIGHTKRHITRILCHKDKDHNCVRLISCKDKASALYYEKRWQERFKPMYNKNGVHKRQIASKGGSRSHGEPKVKYYSKTVRVQFSIRIEEYNRILAFAEEQDRSPGNYISYAIIRALRHDSFFIEDPLEEPRLRIMA